MNLDAHKATLKNFGLSALLYDLGMGVLNRVFGFRIQNVYVIEAVVEHPDQPDVIDIHPLSDAELATWTDRPGYELPRQFVAQARTNGDTCFGAFIDGVLCAYAWYAHQPCTFASGLTASFDPRYAYAYKSLTLPNQRRQNLQRWLKFYIFEYYRSRNKAGLLVAIDSQNFASRRSTLSVGATRAGLWAYTLNGEHYRGWGTRRCKATGFKLSAPPAGPAPLLKPKSTATSLQVQRINSLVELQSVAGAYNQLLQELDNYCAHSYQIGWIQQLASEYFTPNKQLFFLLAWRDGQLVGVAPLQIEHKNWLRGGVRRLYFLGGIQGSLNNMACDFLIPDTGDIRECLEAFRGYLLGPARGAWDILDLAYLPQESPNFAAFESVFPELRKRRESMQTYMVTLPASMASYCSRLDAKVYREMRRCQRRLDENEPQAKFGVVTELDSSLRDAIAKVHIQRQEELRARGANRHRLLDHPRQREVLIKLIDWSIENKQLKLYHISIDDKLIAFFLAFSFKTTTHLFITGFDSAYTRYGPAKLLMLYLVETEIARGCQLINLSTGTTKLKEEFCDLTVDNWHYFGINNCYGARFRHTLWQAVLRLKR